MKNQTTHEFVEGLTPDQIKTNLINALKTLEKIADNSNPKRNPAPLIAGSFLTEFGWFDLTGYRKTVSLGDLAPGSSFHVDQISGVSKSYIVIGPSSTCQHSTQVLNTDDNSNEEFMSISRVKTDRPVQTT